MLFELHTLIIISPWTSAATCINFIHDIPAVLRLADFARGNSGLLSTAILDFTTSQMTSFSLTARLLLLLITGYSIFTCQRQDATCTSRKCIVFKSASFHISFRNWTNLLISLRSHRQIFGSTLALKLNSSVNVLLLIMIANDCSAINPGPIQNPCGECGKAVKSNQRAIECEECCVWFHKRCLGINSVNFKILEQHPSYIWICCNCGLPSFTSSFSNRTWSILTDLHFYRILLSLQMRQAHCTFPARSTQHLSEPTKETNALMQHPQSNILRSTVPNRRPRTK